MACTRFKRLSKLGLGIIQSHTTLKSCLGTAPVSLRRFGFAYSNYKFLGFLVQARNDASGYFLGSLLLSAKRLIECFEVTKRYVSHTNKTSEVVELQWKVTGHLSNAMKVRFRANAVKSFLRYYALLVRTSLFSDFQTN